MTTKTKSISARKRFLSGSQVMAQRGGTRCRNLEAGVEVEAMTECCLLALSMACSQWQRPQWAQTSHLSHLKKPAPRPPKPHFVALDYFIVLHILTQELPPHILWIRMSQNTGMWELLGNRGVQSATCTLGEQQLVLRRERF